MNARSEAKELRALVAVMERERENMEVQLEDYEDELASERERVILLEDKLSRHRSEEREDRSANEAEIVIRDLQEQLTSIHSTYEQQIQLLNAQILTLTSKEESINSNAVIKDLESQLTAMQSFFSSNERHYQQQISELTTSSQQEISRLTEELNTLQATQKQQPTEVDHEKFLKIMDEKESIHRQKVSQLASKVATLELQNSKLTEEAGEDKLERITKMKTQLEAYESEKERTDCELLTLRTELAELRMCRELLLDDTSDSIEVKDKEPQLPTSELFDLGEEELSSLSEQYESRIRHFTSLKKDVLRELHSRRPLDYSNPDQQPSMDNSFTINGQNPCDNDNDNDSVLDSEWTELASWMSSRFGSRTSLKELRSYIKAFSPKMLRAPFHASSPDTLPKWRESSPSDSSMFTSSSDRTAFDKLFNEGRQRGRALYVADQIGRETETTLSPPR